MEYQWVRMSEGGLWEPARRLETGLYEVHGREGPVVVFEEGAAIDTDEAMNKAEGQKLHKLFDEFDAACERTLANLDAAVSAVSEALANMEKTP